MAKSKAKAGTKVAPPGFEASDVAPRFVLIASGILFGGVGCSILIVLALLHVISPTHPDRLPARQEQMTGPGLEVSPAADGALLQAKAENRLHGYGSTDTSHQGIRIPIERAMALLSAKGWPDTDNQGDRR